MKKKRFYNNKKRNEKWTEPVKGRKISFADKYIEAGNGSDKYDKNRIKEKKPVFTKEHFHTFIKYLVVIVCCFAIISVGYTAMDFYIDRNAMPDDDGTSSSDVEMSTVDVTINSMRIEPLVMDGNIMLSAVIESAHSDGYTSVTFDIKRDDGTVGYNSSLATIDMYGARSSPASDIQKSINQLISNDILPVARISCYKDNVASAGDLTAGITVGGELYKDDDGYSYLNPDSPTTYNYIKGLIDEVRSMGVTVFILDNCDLPEDISSDYNDGFQALAEKLYNDFGSDVKLLTGVEITIDSTQSEDAESETADLETQWQTATEGLNSENIIFEIKAEDIQEVKEFLDSQDSVNYILQNEE